MIFGGCALFFVNDGFGASLDRMAFVIVTVGGPVGFVWTTFRLICAYRIYLRFHHAIATVLVSQFIIVLLLLIALGYAPR